jgi:hypothetical protein
VQLKRTKRSETMTFALELVKSIGFAMSALGPLCPELRTSGHLGDINALGQ